MKTVWALSVALLALVSTLAPIAAQSCGARVRKDWDALTATEKATYKGALAAAMDSGAYIKFVEMHTEMRSEMEAHRQCMFIYWHRLLLVVFENMLRGQGSQYACVTVPYYNWMAASNRVLSNACSTLGDCSAITSELGGYTSGFQQTVNINGIDNSGRCVNQSPLDHFCQSGTVSGSACARCVPRGDWGSTGLPSSASYASVRQQVFNAANIGQMSPNVEQGCHNNVHSNLDGTMGTFASPSDPIFWSHHAMVDALHTIFHHCRVGDQRMTFAQKAAHPVAWTSCARRNNGGPFNPADVITMRTGVNGNNPIPGSQDPLIGRYFNGVPNQFAGLMDVRDLGSSSYSYELSGQLASMYNNCDGTPAPSSQPSTAPQPATPAPQPVGNPPVAVPSPAPIFNPAPAPAPVSQPMRCNWWMWMLRRCGNGRRLEAEHGRRHRHDNNDFVNLMGTQPTGTSSSPSALSTYDGNNNNKDVVLTNRECPYEKHVSSWYEQTMAKMGGQCPEVMADLERQACMFHDQCLGGIPDYTPEFKATWQVNEPRCLSIVKAVKYGKQQIRHQSWRSDMESFFGCPKPANATQLVQNNQNVNQNVDQNGGTASVVQAVTDTLSGVVQS